jgi:hypothetical protein
MNYLTQQLKLLLSGDVVATAAGKANPEWTLHNVQYSQFTDEFVGATNIGRLPVVLIQESQAEYLFESSPNHGGTRNTEWVIRIICPTFLNRPSDHEILHRIKEAILSQFFSYSQIEFRNSRVSPVSRNPYAIYIDLTIESETSFGNEYDEE